MLPVKHSVAVLIHRGTRFLIVRRAEDDDELPGVWGLPAGTLRGTETVEDVIVRIGSRKLGVKLTPIRQLSSGSQDRPGYRLEMELWEAAMEGEPSHPEWKWGTTGALQSGMTAGSLCCRLAIEYESRGG